MERRPKLYDHNGLLIGSQPSKTDNLSPEAQALIEARVNTAASNLRNHNSVHLEKLAQKYANKWCYLTGLSTLAVCVLAFYAPPQILDSITKQVDQKLTEPMLQDSADRVIADKMSGYVDEKMKPLQDQAVTIQISLDSIHGETQDKQDTLAKEQFDLATQLENVNEIMQSLRNQATAFQAALESTQRDVNEKQDELARKQDQIAKQLRITELSVSAKAGSRPSYNELLTLQDNPEQPADLINASLKEIELYFDADRNQLSVKTLMRAATKKDPGYAVDEVMHILFTSPRLTEAAINTLAKLKSQGSVRKLCSIAQESDDLRAATRATRAIKMITGESIRPLEFDKVAKWWKDNSSNFIYNGSYSEYSKVMVEIKKPTITPANLSVFIEELSITISSDPEALHSRCLKAGFSLILNKPEFAKQLLDEVREKRSDYYWLHVWDAAYHLKTNNIQEAVRLINLALSKSPVVVERSVRFWEIFAPIQENDEIDWPSKKKVITENE